MPRLPERDLEALQVEIAKLRQTLDGLDVAAQQGLPVAEAQAAALECGDQVTWIC